MGNGYSEEGEEIKIAIGVKQRRMQACWMTGHDEDDVHTY